MGKILAAVAILILLFTVGTDPISQGVERLRTDNITQNIVVTTAEASTNSTAVLTRDLFLGSTSKVGAITSNVTETPLPISYDVATNTLTIDGMTANSTHLLSINYEAETTDTLWSALGPFLNFLVYMSIFAALGYALYSTRKRGRR